MLMAIGARRISAKADFGSGPQKGFWLWTLEPRSQLAQAAVSGFHRGLSFQSIMGWFEVSSKEVQ
jgi:hypothetical protein